MSKIKSKYFDFINSEDYENFLYNSPQVDAQEVFTASRYPSSELLKKRLKARFKQDKKTRSQQS